MHDETIDWIASKAISAIRNGETFPEQAAYELGGMPFVDPLRGKVVSEDKQHILRLIQNERWWNRYLGTNISRPILDPDIVGAVQSMWKKEKHFHTQLAMIYLLIHHGISESEVGEVIAQLEDNRDKFIACMRRFYEGHPDGTWGALCLRLQNPRFEGARPIYLLALSILAETSELKPGPLPDIVRDLTNANSQTIRDLATRLEEAVGKEEVDS